MTYDEMHAKAAEKIGHCRVAGGLNDEDVATQVLDAMGIMPGELAPAAVMPDAPPIAMPDEPAPDAEPAIVLPAIDHE